MKTAINKFEYLKRRVLYRWQYAKCPWIAKDHPCGRVDSEKYPLAKTSTAYISYGDVGWIWAWIAFNIFLPNKWFGKSCGSWSKIRNIVSSNNTKNYEKPNKYRIPKINGWQAAIEMFHQRSVFISKKERKNENN
ncbi:MAG TPA: hypothetical protein VMX17_06965 [Candidatus Glassbacteria bacterium]|nr:hypothetical protein [Candidatus Glassbacteria bacterium]